MSYTIELKNDKYLDQNIADIKKLGFKLVSKKWVKKID